MILKALLRMGTVQFLWFPQLRFIGVLSLHYLWGCPVRDFESDLVLRMDLKPRRRRVISQPFLHLSSNLWQTFEF